MVVVENYIWYPTNIDLQDFLITDALTVLTTFQDKNYFENHLDYQHYILSS